MKSLLILIAVVIFSSAAQAAVVQDDLHVTIQATDSGGSIETGSFDFVFNITNETDCSAVLWSNTTTLTTDSRGRVSYYLEDVSLPFDQQYYLCYYRDGVLKSNSSLAYNPFAFMARNSTLSGLIADSNFDMNPYNLSMGENLRLSGNDPTINFSRNGAITFDDNGGKTFEFNHGVYIEGSNGFLDVDKQLYVREYAEIDEYLLVESNLTVNDNSFFEGNLTPKTTLIHDIGSGSNRWRGLYAQNISADYVDITYDLEVDGTIFASFINATNMNVTNIDITNITTETITAQYIYNPFFAGWMDMRADPWYLGGTNLQIAESLVVGGNLTADWGNFNNLNSDTIKTNTIQERTAGNGITISNLTTFNEGMTLLQNEIFTLGLGGYISASTSTNTITFGSTATSENPSSFQIVATSGAEDYSATGGAVNIYAGAGSEDSEGYSVSGHGGNVNIFPGSGGLDIDGNGGDAGWVIIKEGEGGFGGSNNGENSKLLVESESTFEKTISLTEIDDIGTSGVNFSGSGYRFGSGANMELNYLPGDDGKFTFKGMDGSIIVRMDPEDYSVEMWNEHKLVFGQSEYAVWYNETANEAFFDGRGLFGGDDTPARFIKNVTFEDNVTIDNSLIVKDLICSGSTCGDVNDFLSGGGNLSWNETYARTIFYDTEADLTTLLDDNYANIQWNYNQTLAAYTLWNDAWLSTFNSTYNTWAYNQTIPSQAYADAQDVIFNNSIAAYVDNNFAQYQFTTNNFNGSGNFTGNWGNFNNLNITGTSYLGTVKISSDTIRVDNIEESTAGHGINLKNNTQIDGTVTVGADADGYDAILFGSSSGNNITWDESVNRLFVTGGINSGPPIAWRSALEVTSYDTAKAPALTTVGRTDLGGKTRILTSGSYQNSIYDVSIQSDTDYTYLELISGIGNVYFGLNEDTFAMYNTLGENITFDTKSVVEALLIGKEGTEIKNNLSVEDTITLGSVGNPGCISVRDTDNGGWSKLQMLNGAIVNSTGAC